MQMRFNRRSQQVDWTRELRELGDALLNAYLVVRGVRPAMLLESFNMGETSRNGPKSAALIQRILKNFPQLRQTNDAKHESYTFLHLPTQSISTNHIDNKNIGEILGYPCPMTFDELSDRDVAKWSMDIYAHGFNGDRYHIISCMCLKNKNKSFDATARRMARSFQDCLLSDDSPFKVLIRSVDATVTYVPSRPELLALLLRQNFNVNVITPTHFDTIVQYVSDCGATLIANELKLNDLRKRNIRMQIAGLVCAEKYVTDTHTLLIQRYDQYMTSKQISDDLDAKWHQEFTALKS